MRLSDFRILSLDCYGTLIDWETGIWTALQALATRAGQTREAALEAFASAETCQQRETPAMRYFDVLARVYRALALQWRVSAEPWEAERFADSVRHWPAFPDTAGSLRRLARFYRLVVVANVDLYGFSGSFPKLGVEFDAVYTAEEIGSYKPDLANFQYMLERLRQRGFAPADVLHTAQSLYHDHALANALGLASCWIDRRYGVPGEGATPTPPAGVHWNFRSLHWPS